MLKRFAAFAACSLVALSAAAYGETINFTNQTGTGAFTSDTQGNFTVTNTAGQFFIGQGFGDPVPDIYTDTNGTVTVTRTAGGDFTFSSVDLSSGNAGSTYVITGLLGGMQIFSTTGTVSGVDRFAAYGTGYSADLISSLTIQLHDATAESDLDNITVTRASSATPEPSSLLLLGTGVVGMMGAVRRRLQA